MALPREPLTAVVHALTSEKGALLNGKGCRIEGYDPVSMRYACVFEETGVPMKLKAANLTINGADRSSVPSYVRYDIVPILGKGLGVISTKRIDRLSRVMIEKPILECSFLSKNHELDPEHIFQQLGQLSTEQKAALLDLSNAYRSPEDDYSVENIRDHIKGILDCNVFGGKVDDAARSMGGIALCLDMARLNHSCTPNCEFRWNVAVDELPCVYALRDIEEGEELTLSYVLPTQSRSDRRSELRRHRFTCQCEACKSTDQDASRELIEQTVSMKTVDIETLGRALERLREIKLAHPNHEAILQKRLSEEYMRKGFIQQALDAAENALPVLVAMHGPKAEVTVDMLKTVNELKRRCDGGC